ncbi:MAG: hypothetical protein KIT17_03585 [Rubrivivax sp.]|nr:hypothetical protein [Rubrivivax sp.]
MSRLAQLAAGIALGVACAGAAARMHQICFEGPPQPQGTGYVPTAIFGCAIDGTGTCTISARGLTERKLSPLDVGLQSPGTFRHFEGAGTAPMSATITFVDNGITVTRSCTVTPFGAIPPYGHGTPGAVLTGFSTDSSGLATTGVWKLQTATNHVGNVHVYVPAGFVVVGGGAMGTDSPIGALISGSWLFGYQNHAQEWFALTAEGGGAAQPHRPTVFVIGLRIEGMTSHELRLLVNPNGHGNATASSSSVGQGSLGQPADQVSAPSGRVVVGGGFIACPTSGCGGGQFTTVSAPLVDGYTQCDPAPNGGFECHFVILNVRGWRSESKEHIVAAPGSIATQVIALPPTVSVGGTTYNVRARVVSATSGIAAHPAVDVGGLRGEFALTGIGAAVDWRRYDQAGNQTAAGNLLWKLEPRADLGGASVASKDHVISSPARITGYALGIKLVP